MSGQDEHSVTPPPASSATGQSFPSPPSSAVGASIPPLLRRWPLVTLTRVAAMTGIGSLLIVIFAVLFPVPLAVVASMTVGQGLGAVALICYLLAIFGEVASHARERARARRSLGPPAS